MAEVSMKLKEKVYNRSIHGPGLGKEEEVSEEAILRPVLSGGRAV